MAFEELFREESEHGLLIAIALPHEDALDVESTEVVDEERALVSGAHRRRQRTFVGGRIALHRALRGVGSVHGPILANPRGAPLVLAPFLGSVSHKDTVAVALARGPSSGPARADAIGIDVEVARARDVDIGRHVLTERERAALGGSGLTREREVVLRFSMKEALYKVLDPFLHRYIGFLEVEIDPLPDGGAHVHTQLKEGSCPVVVDVRWRERDGLFLSTARATLVVEPSCAP
jgi:4'-phosphopantetheinyl transferase EntD